MNREYVTSSNVASIGYDAESCILEVEFNNGAIYHYYDVPSYIYDEIMNADSKGSYLHRNVKGELFLFTGLVLLQCDFFIRELLPELDLT